VSRIRSSARQRPGGLGAAGSGSPPAVVNSTPTISPGRESPMTGYCAGGHAGRPSGAGPGGRRCRSGLRPAGPWTVAVARGTRQRVARVGAGRVCPAASGHDSRRAAMGADRRPEPSPVAMTRMSARCRRCSRAKTAGAPQSRTGPRPGSGAGHASSASGAGPGRQGRRRDQVAPHPAPASIRKGRVRWDRRGCGAGGAARPGTTGWPSPDPAVGDRARNGPQ